MESGRAANSLGSLSPFGERVGVRGPRFIERKRILLSIDRPYPLTPPLSQSKSDLSDFDHSICPNSGKPDFGLEREQTERVARLCVNWIGIRSSVPMGLSGRHIYQGNNHDEFDEFYLMSSHSLH